MAHLIHIRVGKEIKKRMDELIEQGLFSNKVEIAREGIRDLLLKYKDIKKEKDEKEEEKKEKKKFLQKRNTYHDYNIYNLVNSSGMELLSN